MIAMLATMIDVQPPRKRGVYKRSEFIDRKNKVAIFTLLSLRDTLSKWHQIYCGVIASTQGRPDFKF